MLRRIPWDVMQDETGVPTTDFVAVVAQLLIALAQDQKRAYPIDSKEDLQGLPTAVVKDQKTVHPTDSKVDLTRLPDHVVQDQMRAMPP